jgi:hypothetical protein
VFSSVPGGRPNRPGALKHILELLRLIDIAWNFIETGALFPSLIRPSATFSQLTLGEGCDEGGRLSSNNIFKLTVSKKIEGG